MALHWSVADVEDFDNLCFNQETDELFALTEILIFMSMAAGYNKITEKNVEEIHRRLKILFELDFYKYRAVKHEAFRPLHLEEIKCHVGLWTNASTKTKRRFEADVRYYRKKAEERKLRAEERREVREAAEAEGAASTD